MNGQSAMRSVRNNRKLRESVGKRFKEKGRYTFPPVVDSDSSKKKPITNRVVIREKKMSGRTKERITYFVYAVLYLGVGLVLTLLFV